MSEEPSYLVDAVGRRCPVPVIELARHIVEVDVGAVIGVRADDEAARLDVPAWCEMRGHAYLGEAPAPDPATDPPTAPTYLVRRLH